MFSRLLSRDGPRNSLHLFSELPGSTTTFSSSKIAVQGTIHFHHEGSLVTAHPDDESLFFAPTLTLCFAKRKSTRIVLYAEVYLLCCHSGQADGLAKSSTQVVHALDVIGIEDGKTVIVDKPRAYTKSQALRSTNVLVPVNFRPTGQSINCKDGGSTHDYKQECRNMSVGHGLHRKHSPLSSFLSNLKQHFCTDLDCRRGNGISLPKTEPHVYPRTHHLLSPKLSHPIPKTDNTLILSHPSKNFKDSSRPFPYAKCRPCSQAFWHFVYAYSFGTHHVWCLQIERVFLFQWLVWSHGSIWTAL